MFTIENNVLKGRVISNDNGYTSVGKLIFDTFRSKPNFIWQVDIFLVLNLFYTRY